MLCCWAVWLVGLLCGEENRSHTASFLFLFQMGNSILKQSRSQKPKSERAPGLRASPVAMKSESCADLEPNHTDSTTGVFDAWVGERRIRLPFRSRCKSIEYYFGCRRGLFMRDAESKWNQCITVFSCYLILWWDPLEREYPRASFFYHSTIPRVTDDSLFSSNHCWCSYTWTVLCVSKFSCCYVAIT